MLFTDGAHAFRGYAARCATYSPAHSSPDSRAGVETIADVGDRPSPRAGEPFDFMSEIALPLPIAVIGDWLDLEPTTAELLRELSPAIIRMLGALADTDEIAAGAAASGQH